MRATSDSPFVRAWVVADVSVSADIGLPSGKSLFQLQAERILRLRQLAAAAAGKGACVCASPPSIIVVFVAHSRGCLLLSVDVKEVSIPWYIMTSDGTHHPTIEFFRKNNHFGLPASDFHFFEQVLRFRQVPICLHIDSVAAIAAG